MRQAERANKAPYCPPLPFEDGVNWLHKKTPRESPVGGSHDNSGSLIFEVEVGGGGDRTTGRDKVVLIMLRDL